MRKLYIIFIIFFIFGMTAFGEVKISWISYLIDSDNDIFGSTKSDSDNDIFGSTKSELSCDWAGVSYSQDRANYFVKLRTSGGSKKEKNIDWKLGVSDRYNNEMQGYFGAGYCNKINERIGMEFILDISKNKSQAYFGTGIAFSIKLFK